MSRNQRRTGNDNDPDFDRGNTQITNTELFRPVNLKPTTRRKNEQAQPSQWCEETNSNSSSHSSQQEDVADDDGVGLVFRVPDAEALVAELQSVYKEIGKLEQACSKQHEPLRTMPFSEPKWANLYKTYETLIDKYYDFMFLAYHPTATSQVRGLVKKYRITMRIWNTGLFGFLDLLRPKMPQSKDMMARFIHMCFATLPALTEPAYDIRSVVSEALGELARFQMQQLKNGDSVNWQQVAYHWYTKSLMSSPGVGRVYHHTAVVCLSHIDSLFNFCKSMDATVPFSQARQTIETLFQTVEGDKTGGSTFVKIHQCAWFGDDSELTSLISKFFSFMKDSNKLESQEIILRAGVVAVCNVQAMTGYGYENNELNALLKGGKAGTDPTNNVTKRIAFKFLQKHLLQGRVSHLVVWLHFMLALDTKGFDYMEWQDEGFDFDLLLKTLNACLERVYQQLDKDRLDYQGDLRQVIPQWRKKPASGLVARDQDEMIQQMGLPLQKERPLPEEIALLGLSWTLPLLMDRQYISHLELGLLDECSAGFFEEPNGFAGAGGQSELVGKARDMRIVELALEFSGKGNGIKLGDGGFYIGSKQEEEEEEEEEESDSADSAYDLSSEEEGGSEAPPSDYSNGYTVFDTIRWLALDINHDTPYIAISHPQLAELYSMMDTSKDAKRAIKWIVDGLGSGTIRYFSQKGEFLGTVHPEDLTPSKLPTNDIRQFVENMQLNHCVEYISE